MTPEDVARYLSDANNARPVEEFPSGFGDLRHPGMYSWWVDDEGRHILARPLGEDLPSLIYAGQAGATSARSGRPSNATLLSRIDSQHLKGNARGSTFRMTISALLAETLSLEVAAPRRLTPADQSRVSAWIRSHLSLIPFPYEDRDHLGELEQAVLAIIDPPLNIQGMPPTTVRRNLSRLRKTIAQPGATPRPNTQSTSGTIRFLVPTDGPAGWQRLLADPEMHWVTGRSARTMANAWEESNGWPDEMADVFAATPALKGLEPVYGFPEFKVPLPGGSRSSQTDLMVIATDGLRTATVAIEGKVNESFGPLVADWLGRDPAPGKETRLNYLCELLTISRDYIGEFRYQLLHRTASAIIEARRNGSSIAAMVVHSWGAEDEGFADYSAYAAALGIDAHVGEISYSTSADVWLGWVRGNPKYLRY